MKVLVTGGAGFIGSHLVRYLLEQGTQVINIDKLTYSGNLRNLNESLHHPNYFFYQVDICDTHELQSIIATHKPDAIIHTAAESHVDRSIDCADEFIKTNITGTYSLLKVSLHYYHTLNENNRKKFRFIHLSTDEVFGALGLEGKFDESTPYSPNSPYASSKAASDLLVHSYYKTYGFPALIVNSSNNYGPHQYPEKLIPLVILNALEHKALPLYGNGQQMRDWLYVNDHVKALWSLLCHGKIGESYCVGANNECSNLDLVKKICFLLDEIKPSGMLKSYSDLITFVQDRPGHDFRYATDASKLQSHTGWQPEIPFEQGLRKTVEWYINQALVGSTEASRRRMGLGQTA